MLSFAVPQAQKIGKFPITTLLSEGIIHNFQIHGYNPVIFQLLCFLDKLAYSNFDLMCNRTKYQFIATVQEYTFETAFRSIYIDTSIFWIIVF